MQGTLRTCFACFACSKFYTMLSLDFCCRKREYHMKRLPTFVNTFERKLVSSAGKSSAKSIANWESSYAEHGAMVDVGALKGICFGGGDWGRRVVVTMSCCCNKIFCVSAPVPSDMMTTVSLKLTWRCARWRWYIHFSRSLATSGVGGKRSFPSACKSEFSCLDRMPLLPSGGAGIAADKRCADARGVEWGRGIRGVGDSGL